MSQSYIFFFFLKAKLKEATYVHYCKYLQLEVFFLMSQYTHITLSFDSLNPFIT